MLQRLMTTPQMEVWASKILGYLTAGVIYKVKEEFEDEKEIVKNYNRGICKIL